MNFGIVADIICGGFIVLWIHATNPITSLLESYCMYITPFVIMCLSVQGNKLPQASGFSHDTLILLPK